MFLTRLNLLQQTTTEENVDQIIPIFPPELVVSLLTRFNFSDALCNIASTIGNIVTVSEDSESSSFFFFLFFSHNHDQKKGSYQVRLVQAGALPLVINLLKHESFEVQTKAVRAINNLAEGGLSTNSSFPFLSFFFSWD